MSYERRKVRVGKVVSDKMDKTVVVAVEWHRPHRIYSKPVRRETRFMAHDPENECKLGDTVRIREGRPLSKTKRWRIVDILQRQDLAEVQPGELTATDESAIIAEAQATQAQPEAPATDVSAKVAIEEDAPPETAGASRSLSEMYQDANETGLTPELRQEIAEHNRAGWPDNLRNELSAVERQIAATGLTSELAAARQNIQRRAADNAAAIASGNA